MAKVTAELGSSEGREPSRPGYFCLVKVLLALVAFHCMSSLDSTGHRRGGAVFVAEAIENVCSACNVTAAELSAILAEEKPRNHLDMRHRLNSKGEREGKVIDYRVSELRVVEILEDLCMRLKNYSLVLKEDNYRHWSNDNEMATFGDRFKYVAVAQGKALSQWCDRLVEVHEDQLTGMIRSGELSAEANVLELLCDNMTKYCRGATEKRLMAEALVKAAAAAAAAEESNSTESEESVTSSSSSLPAESEVSEVAVDAVAASASSHLSDKGNAAEL